MTKKSSSSGRSLPVRLKASRKRTLSSQRWLKRQLTDPYVQQAQKEGYRSRAAYKLIEIDDKFNLLKPGARVVDLGATPGGWAQVARKRIGSQGLIIGVDLTPLDPIEGVQFICGDFCDPQVIQILKNLLKDPVDVVLSDMATPSTGHPPTDHLRIMALAEDAFFFAQEVLKKDGAFVVKVLRGGTEKTLLDILKKHFKKVHHFKPPASRADSAEIYVVAIGFRP